MDSDIFPVCALFSITSSCQDRRCWMHTTFCCNRRKHKFSSWRRKSLLKKKTRRGEWTLGQDKKSESVIFVVWWESPTEDSIVAVDLCFNLPFLVFFQKFLWVSWPIFLTKSLCPHLHLKRETTREETHFHEIDRTKRRGCLCVFYSWPSHEECPSHSRSSCL